MSSAWMRSSSWAVRGFQTEGDSSTAVVETDSERECVEVDAPPEPEPEPGPEP
jgi:hypothetical protein